MGQRSQIYVIYKDNQNRDCISATYFQWNYGERMISRARYLMGWIKAQNNLCSNLYSDYLPYVAHKNQDFFRRFLFFPSRTFLSKM